MKKKLLTLLLSIAVVLTSTVTVFAADLGDNPTIADILPENLLTSSSNEWYNENGYSKAYVYNDWLYFQDKGSPTTNISLSVTTPLTKVNDNYTVSSNGRTFTFTMNSNDLTSISVSNSGISDYLDGTYIAPISEVSFAYTDFNFSNFTFALPTAQDGKYEIDNNSYQVGLIKDETLVYDYDKTNNYWIDKSNGDQICNNPDMSKIDKAFINFKIVSTGANTFAENTIKVIATKEGTTTTKELNGIDGPFEEGFNLKDTKKIECNLLFNAPVIKEVNIDYSEFDFLKLTMKHPTVPTDVNYKMSESNGIILYDLFLLKNGETVAAQESYEGIWVDPHDWTTPIDVNDPNFEYDAGSISMMLIADDEYRFIAEPAVKANTKELVPADFLEGIVVGKQEGYSLDPEYDDIAICLMFKRYEITEGKDAVINVDKNKDNILFTSIAEYNIFEKVLVDDEEIASTNYTVEEGSTKVILNAEYLKTLSSGKHTLTIVSTDGNASTYFTITRNPKPNPGYVVPKTGVE